MLLERMSGFFARDPANGQEAVERRDRHAHARLTQLKAQFVRRRNVTAACVQCHDRVRMRLDLPQSRVAVLRLYGIATGAAALIVLADHRRGRYPELPRLSPATHPLVNRGQCP